MNIYFVAPDDELHVVLARIRSAVGVHPTLRRITLCAIHEYVVWEGRGGIVQIIPDAPPPMASDVILVFGDAERPEIDAVSRVFVVDGLKFLKAIGRGGRPGGDYLRSLVRSGPVEECFVSYSRAYKAPEAILPPERFFINSFPKSGTIWLMAMVGEALGISTDKHLYLVHGADVEVAYHSVSLIGGVALVRDLRDVVISWYHEALRNDHQSGFKMSRYPDVSSFYYGYFLGRVEGNPQYHFGDLARWINYLSARAIPIVRYEDMIQDAAGTLQWLFSFWRIGVDEAAVERAVSRTSLSEINHSYGQTDTYIGDRLRAGHARAGTAGGWKAELSQDVVDDIGNRFRSFQERFGYANS
ncbi:MAG: hypothetical protein VR74_05310 [Hyphomonas sp. BRH_c22]|uniref:sulfotransferase domain-containing protein n=1 Tax=Hyphomonas sp. BRH_c22 TaxID=1629710 RepID=UPI0005F27550|nr:sulfotransferase domain-containing protein [Hyphomonas sp. BRH_c22]KJS38588.1 MAG: hypothetical protein VR74_05310 [Hyphomonas sp. BRH_c22]